MTRLVRMHPGVLRAHRGQLPALAVVDSVWEAADGQKLIIRADHQGVGFVDYWPPTGRRSIASCPAAVRGAR